MYAPPPVSFFGGGHQAIAVASPSLFGAATMFDFRHTPVYAQTLRDAGLNVTVEGLGWRYWYGAPWFASTLVHATKP